jgi:hypothetical protein
MLAHTLRNILELVPEALPMVKKASVEQELPLDNKDSCIATALQLAYFEKIAFHPVELGQMEKIAKAVHLYGVKDLVADLSDKMVKSAALKKREAIENSTEAFLYKQASFETSTGYAIDGAVKSAEAIELYKQAKERNLEPSDEVIRYSGNGYLNKEAAIKSLAVRFDLTGNTDFVKLASALGRSNEHQLTPELLVNVSNKIDSMDKKAGLNFKGFNFYKEAFFIKEAAMVSAMMIRLAGVEVPYEKFAALGKTRIAQHIGEDVAKEFENGPANFKQVAETLPLDTQRQLLNLTKHA